METEESSLSISYPASKSSIEQLRSQFSGLSAITPGGYKSVKDAIRQLRELRVSIEKRRVELKADALAWGRTVDGQAKALTNLITEIEAPLREAKDEVDAAKENARQAVEAERLRKVEEERAAEESRLRQEREAFEEQRRVELERIATERQALEASKQELAAKARLIDDELMAFEAAKAAAPASEGGLDREKVREAIATVYPRELWDESPYRVRVLLTSNGYINLDYLAFEFADHIRLSLIRYSGKNLHCLDIQDLEQLLNGWLLRNLPEQWTPNEDIQPKE